MQTLKNLTQNMNGLNQDIRMMNLDMRRSSQALSACAFSDFSTGWIYQTALL